MNTGTVIYSESSHFQIETEAFMLRNDPLETLGKVIPLDKYLTQFHQSNLAYLGVRLHSGKALTEAAGNGSGEVRD